MSQTQTKTNPLDDPRVTKNDDGSVTVQLLTPVSVIQGDPAMTAVTLNRVNGRAMVVMLDASGQGSQIEKLMLASAQLVGPVADAFMNNVSGSDFLFLCAVASTFLENGQTTGQ